MSGRTGWLDLSSGCSGDMLLGALVDAGVPLAVLSEAVGVLGLPVRLAAKRVLRAGLAATQVVVDAPERDQPRRSLRDVDMLLDRVPDPVGRQAREVFTALAEAEGRVHGVDPGEVHFHEVGALDALADVVGVCAGLHHLGLSRLVAGPLALGGGSVRSAHGTLPVPGPAVLALIAAAGVPSSGGPQQRELCTPTGAALVGRLVDAWGPMPAMIVQATGSGAGSHDDADRPNVVRLVVGQAVGTDAAAKAPDGEPAVVLETNVDDLDPRVWPAVLARLMSAGASDAWLTPILMKKGRPAHTLSVLCPPADVDRLAAVVTAETPTLGIRVRAVTKLVAGRRMTRVEVGGRLVSVKLGTDAAGDVVTATPEWDDVERVAAALGRPVRAVLTDAATAATSLLARHQVTQHGAEDWAPSPGTAPSPEDQT